MKKTYADVLRNLIAQFEYQIANATETYKADVEGGARNVAHWKHRVRTLTRELNSLGSE